MQKQYKSYSYVCETRFKAVKATGVTLSWDHVGMRLSLVAAVLVASCGTYKPTNIGNLCDIFRGEIGWYEAAVDANEKWGTPIWVMMAIMQQESNFVDDARPSRDWFLGVIPLPRSSSAYGYAQAQNPAWDDYLKGAGNSGADRDDFDDAIDFIGWYTHQTQRQLGISKWDAYNQYLAYHEGRGGYRSGDWKSKSWLKNVATKVNKQSARYNQQLKSCKAELDDKASAWF
jgi:hypothetical protein